MFLPTELSICWLSSATGPAGTHTISNAFLISLTLLHTKTYEQKLSSVSQIEMQPLSYAHDVKRINDTETQNVRITTLNSSCDMNLQQWHRKQINVKVLTGHYERFLFCIEFFQQSSLHFSRIWLKTVMSRHWQWREPLSRFQPGTFSMPPPQSLSVIYSTTGSRCSTWNPFSSKYYKTKAQTYHKQFDSSLGPLLLVRTAVSCVDVSTLTWQSVCMSQQKESKKLIPTQSSPIPQSQ